MEAITKPVLPSDLVNRDLACPKAIKKQSKKVIDPFFPQSDYEEFLVRQCRQLFETRSMVIICQQLSLGREDQKVIRNKLWHKGMTLTGSLFSNNTMMKAIHETKYENLKPLLKGHNLMITSKDDTPLNEMMKILDKSPKVIPLGGLVGERILNHAEIVEYSKIPSIETARGELVGILSTAASKTHSLLNSHQQQLVINLEQLSKGATDS